MSGFALRPDHQMADTSIAAYRAIVPTLTAREQVVYDALGRWAHATHDHPTPHELYRTMKAEGLVTEAVQVLPRITAMVQRGVLRYGPARPDLYTGRSAHVVAIVSREEA